MMRLQKFLPIVLAGFALASCSSGGSEDTFSSGGGGGSGTGSGTGGGGTGTDTVTIGNGTGAGFVPGVIALSQSMLQAGGSTSLTVTFVDSSNTLVGDSITVSFSSACAAGGLANIVESSVTTDTGSATATYSATGCSGDDEITASATVQGTVLRALATVNVAAATVGSMQFVSADPSNIGLQGTGGAGRQETSTVRFRVTDSTGGPVVGSDVQFDLNTSVGGIQLTPTSATSDAQGFVQTVVNSGSVATSVRVTATVVGSSPVIAAQSDVLTITTGIPDNDSFSLSVECANLEAWDVDGEAAQVTARLSDRFNNPVPDGTAVTFTTEGAQIGGSCLTQTTPTAGAGVCSVTWVSQDPRPADGRVTILASAIGEDSFTDVNADGRFSAGDILVEIGEPFQDENENGVYDTGEVFRDFNGNSARDDETTVDYAGFNGLLCDANCNPNQTLFVSDQVLVIMSGSSAVIASNVGGSIDISGGAGFASFDVGDARNQPMPAGTTVRFTTSNGTIVGPSSFTVPCTGVNSPITYGVTIEADTTPDTGTLSIEVTTPRGLITFGSITVVD